MTAYVLAGYIAVFGGLAVYAYRLVLRARAAAASVLQREEASRP